MKRFEKWICGVLAALLACSLIGCSKEDVGYQPPETTRYMMYDFERTGLHGVKACKNFGAVNLNKDKKYVKEGERSLEIIPSQTLDYPYMWFPFMSSLLPEAKNNAYRITDISMEVYATADVKIGVGMYFGQMASSLGTPKMYELKEGWNTVTLENDLAINELGNELKEFYGVYFSFEEYDNRPSVYVDKITIGETEKDIPYENLVKLEVTGEYEEIAFFEYTYQSIIFIPKNTAQIAAPQINVVKASDYGLTATQGERVLRIEPTPKAPEDTERSRTVLFFSNNYLKQINWLRYENNLDDYEIKFDVYQEGTGEGEIYFGLGQRNTGTWGYLSGPDWAVCSTVGEWTTLTIPLKSMSSFLMAPQNLAFNFVDSSDETRAIYVDNFRIARKSVK